MKDTVTNGILWNKAGNAGLVLGLASSIYMFAVQMVSSIPSVFAGQALTFILWIAKFVGCILLMMHFMKRVSSGYAGVDNRTTFKYGVMISLLSAVIFSAVSLANILFISPELISRQFETIMNTYSSMLDTNSMNMLSQMEAMYPQISFFSNLIYCFLYGTVLSAILARNIPARDIFADSGLSGSNNE